MDHATAKSRSSTIQSVVARPVTALLGVKTLTGLLRNPCSCFWEHNMFLIR